MPLYTYKCSHCSSTEEIMEPWDSQEHHFCKICLANPNEVCYHQGYGYVKGLGLTIRMFRQLSKPTIHQTGYNPGDARYRRGSK